MEPTYHVHLIKRLGGKTVLAAALGLERSVMAKWHVRGIPAKYWPVVAKVAEAQGIKVCLFDLAKTKPVALGKSKPVQWWLKA